MNFDITIQENQLSLTNRAMHLQMQWCGWPPKTLLYRMRYHAEFCRSRSNNVRISREEPAKLASAIRPRRLGMQGAADHLKTSLSPICYHAQSGRSSWENVVIDRTRSSADADNGLDAFSSQSRSTNMVFWVHCDFSLSMWSAPTDSLRHFHSSSVL